MLERLLIATVVVVGLVVAIAAVRLALRIRDRRLLTRLREAQPAETTLGVPRIVYFTTTSCVVCRLQQEPAIERLQAELPELVVEQHDAVEERALADQYGILSVPTTAVYDRDGDLVVINRGFAPVAQLYAQATGAEHISEGGQAMAAERLPAPNESSPDE